MLKIRLYLIAVVCFVAFIGTAHLFAPPAYVWAEHTISQLAAQGYGNAWMMRAGFLVFGSLVVLGAVQKTRTAPGRWYRELPLMLYGLGIFLSGLFSAQPFIEGAAFSDVEANLHSVMATAAGLGMSVAIVLYSLTAQGRAKRLIHVTAFVLVVGLSALFGQLSAGAGLAQRLLYLVGLAWLVFIDLAPDHA